MDSSQSSSAIQRGEHRVPDCGGKLLPPFPAELQPAVACSRDSEHSFGKLLNFLVQPQGVWVSVFVISCLLLLVYFCKRKAGQPPGGDCPAGFLVLD